MLQLGFAALSLQSLASDALAETGAVFLLYALTNV